MSVGWRKRKRAPAGFEYIEDKLDHYKTLMRDALEDPHNERRRAELTWDVHKVNWMRSRWIYNQYYVEGNISRELYEWCLANKLADAPLIAKWKKPGYEFVCSTTAVHGKSHNFGTNSICRVPKDQLCDVVISKVNGCRGCHSRDVSRYLKLRAGVHMKPKPGDRLLIDSGVLWDDKEIWEDLLVDVWKPSLEEQEADEGHDGEEPSKKARSLDDVEDDHETDRMPASASTSS
mmetsp:Transcript_18034/g.45821  ORF Transcript_18034/g.45821 Transcript_18034/m.45821 type:complete len:233 (+) Transcript_18034:43-741(+)|eukprot:CAMPEP_0177658252 /NCGR_PEP_ID=MMETSP0447-20121125/16696_1 /TAXON_ID=0 /ORGANISM="Stygamoeba regulata, Strain BSH-02190019" /LENGTH=232 /DNA_ID=CAMNT_0019162815 /DNA_START=44 /DNA_END=739 /DNA_ORIENTATION=+